MSLHVLQIALWISVEALVLLLEFKDKFSKGLLRVPHVQLTFFGGGGVITQKVSKQIFNNNYMCSTKGVLVSGFNWGLEKRPFRSEGGNE